MDGGKCIVQVRGVRPFFSDKYDITRHKRYKELFDFDPKNEFDVEKYLESIKPGHLKLKKDEELAECVDVGII